MRRGATALSARRQRYERQPLTKQTAPPMSCLQSGEHPHSAAPWGILGWLCRWGPHSPSSSSQQHLYVFYPAGWPSCCGVRRKLWVTGKGFETRAQLNHLLGSVVIGKWTFVTSQWMTFIPRKATHQSLTLYFTFEYLLWALQRWEEAGQGVCYMFTLQRVSFGDFWCSFGYDRLSLCICFLATDHHLPKPVTLGSSMNETRPKP